MKMSQNTHRWLGLQNGIFYVLFVILIGLLGFVAYQFRFTADWTYGNRNSLSAPTQALLNTLDQPLSFIAYIPDRPELEAELRKIVAKYQRIKPDTSIEFVNPDLDPVRARQDGIQYAGQLAIHLGERSEVVETVSEQTIDNAVQRMSRGGERLVIFLEGHGERNPLASESTGLSQLVSTLERNGFKIQPHNLVSTQSIPRNASFVVIAAPQQDILPGEVDVLKHYIEQGGNLLWLQDPGGLHGLQNLENLLGLTIQEGTVVDANQALQALLGIDHPAIVPVVQYGKAEVVQKLGNTQTLFPFATEVAVNPDAAKEGALAWQSEAFLYTLPSSWLESSSSLQGQVRFDPDSNDHAGPVPIGVTLTRLLEAPEQKPAGKPVTPDSANTTPDTTETPSPKDREQRVAVIGDSDFMLNSFIGQGANLDLATNLFNWLSADDNLLQIPLIRAPDTQLQIGENTLAALGLFFLVALPLGLLLAGTWLWWRRRKR